jgi:hypothetical protein
MPETLLSLSLPKSLILLNNSLSVISNHPNIFLIKGTETHSNYISTNEREYIESFCYLQNISKIYLIEMDAK